jgi:DNA-nicking Smr family endonuclease
MDRAGCMWFSSMTRKPDQRKVSRSRISAPAPDDGELWQRLTEAVKPLHPETRKARPAPKPTAAAKPEIAKAAKPAAMKPPPAVQPSLPVLRKRAIAGLDQRKADRLRRGELDIDARLDLHGMTQEAAHAALGNFMNRAAAQGHRCVLVITGKGAPRPRDEEAAGFMPARSGVLRAAVPRWLAEPTLRPLIVAIHPAAPQHGGDGALYVLLKRKR